MYSHGHIRPMSEASRNDGDIYTANDTWNAFWQVLSDIIRNTHRRLELHIQHAPVYVERLSSRLYLMIMSHTCKPIDTLVEGSKCSVQVPNKGTPLIRSTSADGYITEDGRYFLS